SPGEVGDAGQAGDLAAGQQLSPDGWIDLRSEAGAVHAAVQLHPCIQGLAQADLLKVLQLSVMVNDRPQVMTADQLQLAGLEPALEQHYRLAMAGRAQFQR